MPALRLQPTREEARDPICPEPPWGLLDYDLGPDEALEEQEDHMPDIEGFERADDLIGEEHTVQARLEHPLGQDALDFVDAGDDEGASAAAVMDVAVSMMHVEHLSGLRDIAERGIIVLLTFLLPYIPRISAAIP